MLCAAVTSEITHKNKLRLIHEQVKGLDSLVLKTLYLGQTSISSWFGITPLWYFWNDYKLADT